MELGLLCGLMPDKKAKPTSEQLHLVVQLIAGVSDDGEEFGTASPSNSLPSASSSTPSRRKSPQDRLKEAISSKEGFTKHYLVITLGLCLWRCSTCLFRPFVRQLCTSFFPVFCAVHFTVYFPFSFF